MASECARADVAERRRVWLTERQPAMRREPHRLVFIDETSVNTKMTRARGWARQGKRLKASAPFGKWGTQTFIAGLRHDSLTAPWVIPGAMDRTAFNIYIETQLAPTLLPGDIVILDNLSVHKSAKAEAAVRARGAWMLFLPQYSPDLNPIDPSARSGGILQAQGPPTQGCRAHLRCLDRGSRQHLQPVQTSRMPKLLQSSRLWTRLTVGCSRRSARTDKAGRSA